MAESEVEREPVDYDRRDDDRREQARRRREANECDSFQPPNPGRNLMSLSQRNEVPYESVEKELAQMEATYKQARETLLARQKEERAAALAELSGPYRQHRRRLIRLLDVLKHEPLDGRLPGGHGKSAKQAGKEE